MTAFYLHEQILCVVMMDAEHLNASASLDDTCICTSLPLLIPSHIPSG